MSHDKRFGSNGEEAGEWNGSKPALRSDLVELVMTPLANQIEKAKLDILESNREILEEILENRSLIEITAAGVKEDMDDRQAAGE